MLQGLAPCGAVPSLGGCLCIHGRAIVGTRTRVFPPWGARDSKQNSGRYRASHSAGPFRRSGVVQFSRGAQYSKQIALHLPVGARGSEQDFVLQRFAPRGSVPSFGDCPSPRGGAQFYSERSVAPQRRARDSKRNVVRHSAPRHAVPFRPSGFAPVSRVRARLGLERDLGPKAI